VDGHDRRGPPPLAAYQRRLVSRDAPFDTFAAGLREGDAERLGALGPAAQRGLKLFVGEANCRLCHSGPNFTDGEFHNIGVPPSGGGLPLDPGRYRGVPVLQRDAFRADGPFSDDRDGPAARRARVVANGPDNWGRFKTPSLRNAAETAPYMHQGQLATLEDVLRFYSTLEDAVQLDHHREQVLRPLNLTDQQLADIRAFIESLTGRPLPETLTRPPDGSADPG
jgi:cytochrome c peroxidase